MQLLFSDYNYPIATQTFHSMPFNTVPFPSVSMEGGTPLSCDATTNSVGGKSVSPQRSTLPLSQSFFSEFKHELNEDFIAADQTSSPKTREPAPPHRKRKPRNFPSKHTKSLACLECPKTFRRQCELKKHLKTHSRDFKCDVPDCTSRGFYRTRDLKRHMSSCHGAGEAAGRYFCEYQDCEYATRGFPRSDNCTRHMRSQHQYPSGLETAV